MHSVGDKALDFESRGCTFSDGHGLAKSAVQPFCSSVVVRVLVGVKLSFSFPGPGAVMLAVLRSAGGVFTSCGTGTVGRSVEVSLAVEALFTSASSCARFLSWLSAGLGGVGNFWWSANFAFVHSDARD